MIIYQTIISTLNGYTLISTSVGMIWWLFSIIPASLSVFIIVQKKNGSDLMFYNSLLLAVLFQTILAFLAFIFPSVQSFFLINILRENPNMSYWAQFRMYGFAKYLTGFTGMAQGFLAAIFLYLGFSIKKSYLVFVPFILFSGLINARTSLIIFISSAIIILLFTRIGFLKKILILFGSIIFLLFLVIIFNNFAFFRTNDTFNWIYESINVISDFFRGEITGYFIYATNSDKYILPSGIQLIFGAGTRIFNMTNIGYTSDIGYINDFWVGGLIFSIMYYSFWMKIITSFTKKNKHDYSLVLVLSVTFLLVNFKGIVNTDNDFVSIVFLILINIYYRREKYYDR
jgi:hypothetical protein